MFLISASIPYSSLCSLSQLMFLTSASVPYLKLCSLAQLISLSHPLFLISASVTYLNRSFTTCLYVLSSLCFPCPYLHTHGQILLFFSASLILCSLLIRAVDPGWKNLRKNQKKQEHFITFYYSFYAKFGPAPLIFIALSNFVVFSTSENSSEGNFRIRIEKNSWIQIRSHKI